MSKQWEDVNADTERLEVPGGWLYRVTPLDKYNQDGYPIPEEMWRPNAFATAALVFVPYDSEDDE